MDAFTIITSSACLAASLVGLVCYLAGQNRSACGWWAIASATAGVGNIVNGKPVHAAIDAALLAVALYCWYQNGGGKGWRRRLRRLADAFRPVRRTAPAAGAA